MKKMITCLLAAVGLAPACAQQNFEDEHGECVEIGHIEHVHDQAENGDDLKEG